MGGKIAIIGSGAWGTAMAKVLAEKEKEVVLWCLEETTAAEINGQRRNTRFLPGVELPPNLRGVTDIIQAADGAEFLILASPSLYLLDTVKKLLPVSSIREGETAI
ncbi:MAG: NAD(P)-binding domain-containing protein, partial [Spirochaetaceae bacterium]|nr:NAD(P)-binding domain-containing protein [Spirochaetaceae bacterium]